MATSRTCSDTGEEAQDDEPQRPRETPGLLGRLFWLLTDDTVGGALGFTAAGCLYVDILLPSLLLVVLLPALVGALLVLDYCGRVQEEVRRTCNASVTVLVQCLPCRHASPGTESLDV